VYVPGASTIDADPSDAEAQLTSCNLVTVALIVTGSLSVVDNVTRHPEASVTVSEYEDAVALAIMLEVELSDHLYVYPGVPKLVATLRYPVDAPLQVGLLTESNIAVRTSVSSTETEDVAVHPAPSVTVTE
jgi:hypothetical protein